MDCVIGGMRQEAKPPQGGSSQQDSGVWKMTFRAGKTSEDDSTYMSSSFFFRRFGN
jgi:hypothetical protein